MPKTLLDGEGLGEQADRWIEHFRGSARDALMTALARLFAHDAASNAVNEAITARVVGLESNMRDIIRVTGNNEMENMHRINYALDTCRSALYFEEEINDPLRLPRLP